MEIVQESALQLLARTQQRPDIRGLNSRLFQSGPNPKEIIEITGKSGTGKTLLLLDLIKNCILPKTYREFDIQGYDSNVVFLNTDHHFNIETLVKFIKLEIKNITLKDEGINDIVESCLKKLLVVNIYSSAMLNNQFYLLRKLLCENRQISLIILDSISAFYWEDNLLGGIRQMDAYILNIIKQLNYFINYFDVTLIYTKPHYFKSKYAPKTECSPTFDLSKVNRTIELKEKSVDEKKVNFAHVQTSSDSFDLLFKVTDDGIIWN